MAQRTTFPARIRKVKDMRINCISKYFKKQRLLAKYYPNLGKHIELMKFAEDDEDLKNYFRHIIACKIRCYNRLNKK